MSAKAILIRRGKPRKVVAKPLNGEKRASFFNAVGLLAAKGNEKILKGSSEAQA